MENKQITPQRINNIVWRACDTFRGIVDPSVYKDYVLTMLFLKYLSDLHDDKYQKYLEQFNGDQRKAEWAMRKENFKVPPESHFQYLYNRRHDDNIGELINIALRSLEDANKSVLVGEDGIGVFQNIDFNSTTLGDNVDKNKRLRRLLEDFNDPELDLRPSKIGNADVIGNAYEFLIANFASDAGKKAGEFFTPSEVSELLSKLANPQPGNRIYDPTCGSGSLLIKAAKEVGSDNFSLYGQEINAGTWGLAKMNMLLHGYNDANIRWGDTIRQPKHVEGDKLMKFDVVVANPPFSLKNWGHEVAQNDPYKRFWRGVPPKSRGDWAFITHMVESMNEHGRTAVVVPHGVLFRGSSEGKIRKAMLKENLVEAVIGLPANLFFGTSIPAAILVFNKNKTTPNVLFIDASREYESGKNQNKLRPQDIRHIVDTYRRFKNGELSPGIVEEKYSYVATPEEIEENEYNLNIPRYVDTYEEEPEVDIQAVQAEIEQLETELRQVQAKMKEYLKELGIEVK